MMILYFSSVCALAVHHWYLNHIVELLFNFVLFCCIKVISERDILGTQLVRRNDELALLYEKIKIQQSVLNKGEIQYNQRLEDIRLLKLEIKKLRREKAILQKSVANIEDLR